MQKLKPQRKQVSPAAGTVLISDPFLPDDNFKRTVIMLCEHNEEGSFGFILNKPLGMTIAEAVEGMEEVSLPLYLGGPVEHETLHYLHRYGELVEGSREILPGLWWGGNFEVIRALLNDGDEHSDRIRFFLGYSGWGAGQLQRELDERSWVVARGRSHYVFDHHSELLWKEVLHEMGGQYQLMAGFPESPLLN